jgi:glycine/D-amino acid oxidase-like deaminating enzyme
MTADVIIIGAGVIGAAAALQLRLLGVGDVLVVDRATAGSAGQRRSSALSMNLSGVDHAALGRGRPHRC